MFGPASPTYPSWDEVKTKRLAIEVSRFVFSKALITAWVSVVPARLIASGSINRTTSYIVAAAVSGISPHRWMYASRVARVLLVNGYPMAIG